MDTTTDHFTPLALRVRGNEPANKNIEQQRHFYSTKRKRQKKNLRLSKPPESKAKEILQSLLHASIPKEAVTLPTDTLGK